MTSHIFFQAPLFREFILPFLLVFTILFAVLDKTNVFGEGKRQINAIVSAISGLILLAFPASRDLIVNLIPFMAVVLIILFIFILLYAFVAGDTKDLFSKGIKVTFGIAIAIAVVIAVLVFSGVWDDIWNSIRTSSSIAINIFFLVIIVLAIAVVLFLGKGKSSTASA